MVRLVPITDDIFHGYIESWVEEYAKDKIKSGNWKSEDALELSRQEFNKLLPNGPKTEGHYIFSIQDENDRKNVGVIWFGIKNEGGPSRAFIWNFGIDASFRGKGYGKGALLALDQKLREMGILRVSLHVFGHNKTAIALYEKMGYITTNLSMSKDLK